MSEPKPLNLLWPRMLELVDCLCEAISDCGLDDLCVCQVMPGQDIAVDYVLPESCNNGADGMGWVRLTSVYQTSQFPAQRQTPTFCNDAETAFAFEVGILRSFPIPEDGNPPSPDVLEALTERQVSEALLMQRVILCCYDAEVVLGTYTPLGPQMGGVGGRWTATSLVAP